MITDFAVPDYPTNIQGCFSWIDKLRRKLNLLVSTVGTKIFENLPSGGGLYSPTIFSQPIQFLVLLTRPVKS